MAANPGEERLVTLDYSLDGHELYIVLSSQPGKHPQLNIKELHFRAGEPLTTADLFDFMRRTFEANRTRIVARVNRWRQSND